MAFWRDARGGVAVLFGLLAVPLAGAAGMALDYAFWIKDTAMLQAAADGAALAAVKEYRLHAQPSSSQVQSVAQAYIQAQLSSYANLTETVTPNSSTPSVTVTLGAPARQFISRIIGQGPGSLSVTAKAVLSGQPVPVCMLSLNPTASGALDWIGNSTLQATSCAVQVNSDSTSAVTLTGNATLRDKTNCFVGGDSTTGNASIQASPLANCSPVEDPFRNETPPTYSGCDHTNYSVGANNNQTLWPGVYCGGISLSGNATASLQPGVYVINGGTLSAAGNASMSGTGVVFYLTGSGAGVSLGGNGSIQLTAPTSGDLAGFVFYLDPTASAATTSSFSGNGSMYYQGILYFPTQQVQFSGNALSSTTSPFSMFVADTFKNNGNAALLINFDASKVTVPILPDVYQALDRNGPRLVQ